MLTCKERWFDKSVATEMEILARAPLCDLTSLTTVTEDDAWCILVSPVNCQCLSYSKYTFIMDMKLCWGRGRIHLNPKEIHTQSKHIE